MVRSHALYPTGLRAHVKRDHSIRDLVGYNCNLGGYGVLVAWAGAAPVQEVAADSGAGGDS